MSPVCGIISKYETDVSGYIDTMMDQYAGSGLERKWVTCDDNLFSPDNLVLKPYQHFLGQVSFSIREQVVDHPKTSDDGNITVIFDGNLYNREKLKAQLQICDDSITNSSIVLRFIQDNNYDNEMTMVQDLQSQFDGPFCLVVKKANKIFITRDRIGLRPLFYAEEPGLYGFASKKKPLWAAGFSKVIALRSGTFAAINHDGIIIKEIPLLPVQHPSVNSMDVAVGLYADLLMKSIDKRLSNVKKVGVLLSGGVDSGLLAWLICKAAIKQGIEVIAYTAGMINAEDLSYSRQLAQELGMKHRIKILNEDTIKKYIHLVLAAVEERDIVQIEAGVGVYSALELAVKDGVRTVFSGQGPDELWGGYTWYPNVLSSEGYDGLHVRMADDLKRSDIETFDRENRIAMTLGVEQLFPYADAEIVELASMVATDLKVQSSDDTLGKHPHREAARVLGLPDKYATRLKNAAQNGTGVHEFLNNIALKAGFSPDLVKRMSYHSDNISDEKLASSTRYGYKFDKAELWAVPQHIQLYLDALALRNGLLNFNERKKIQSILKCNISDHDIAL